MPRRIAFAETAEPEEVMTVLQEYHAQSWVIFDRLSRFGLLVHVRFAPKATGVLHCRKMTRCAKTRHRRGRCRSLDPH
jgi:hypothetical protein